MSSNILEAKENVSLTYESPKKEKASQVRTNSILKPSQKDNCETSASASSQLSPKKPPKVSFKNTPIRHRPLRYKAELPQRLDSWEEIRNLDEEECWTERTQVVTKEDHQLHLEAAKKFIVEIIDNLPYITGEESVISTSDIPEQEMASGTQPKSPSKIIKPIKGGLKSPPIPKSISTNFPIFNDKQELTMDDITGPLDPAIASVDSLLSVGADDVPRTFSPIGSERTSPDPDNMIGSREDIDKLLSRHDVITDNGDILPPFVNYHNSTDVTAIVLNEPSPTAEEVPSMPSETLETAPVKLEEELKISGEEKDEIESDELSLPVRPRGCKPVEKMPVNTSETEAKKEKFKKPFPPKPWKMKKKKEPQQDDPFMIVCPSQKNGDNIVSNVIGGTSNAETSKPESGLSVDYKPSVHGEKSVTPGITAVEPAGDAATFACFDNGVESAEADDQDDIGLGDNDFKSAGDAFSLELDYLENFGNSANMDKLSALARQSLYVKFDPLVKGSSPNQDLDKMKADVLSQKALPSLGDDLLLINTPPSRLAAAKRISQKAHEDSPPSVDKLLTFSPSSKPSAVLANEENQQHRTESTAEKPTTAKLPTTKTQQPIDPNEPNLVQPLLFCKSDIESALKKEREALLKQAHEESAIRDMETQEISKKCQSMVDENNKLRRENEELRTVMNEYERTMAEMIETGEKSKTMLDLSKSEIINERDQLQADLNSVESAFSDLHRRYEKIKGVVENFKKNEEILKKAAKDYQEKLRKSEEKYQLLKKHAEEKIETANIEINRVRRSNDSEMAVMRAALKKEQTKGSSLEQSIQQKINENIELTSICDELIQRASGPK